MWGRGVISDSDSDIEGIGKKGMPFLFVQGHAQNGGNGNHERKLNFQNSGGGNTGYRNQSGIKAQRKRRTCISDKPCRTSYRIVLDRTLHL